MLADQAMQVLRFKCEHAGFSTYCQVAHWQNNNTVRHVMQKTTPQQNTLHDTTFKGTNKYKVSIFTVLPRDMWLSSTSRDKMRKSVKMEWKMETSGRVWRLHDE